MFEGFWWTNSQSETHQFWHLKRHLHTSKNLDRTEFSTSARAADFFSATYGLLARYDRSRTCLPTLYHHKDANRTKTWLASRKRNKLFELNVLRKPIMILSRTVVCYRTATKVETAVLRSGSAKVGVT